MKTPIAITLIIMGGLLIMTPVLADYLYQCNVVSIFAKANSTNVMLAGQMSETYRLGCWLTGSAMAGVAVLCSMARRKEDAVAGRTAAAQG